jgi:hypothetical protein
MLTPKVDAVSDKEAPPAIIATTFLRKLKENGHLPLTPSWYQSKNQSLHFEKVST